MGEVQAGAERGIRHNACCLIPQPIQSLCQDRFIHAPVVTADVDKIRFEPAPHRRKRGCRKCETGHQRISAPRPFRARNGKHEADCRVVDRREGTLAPEVLLENAVFEEAVQGAIIAV